MSVSYFSLHVPKCVCVCVCVVQPSISEKKPKSETGRRMCVACCVCVNGDHLGEMLYRADPATHRAAPSFDGSHVLLIGTMFLFAVRVRTQLVLAFIKKNETNDHVLPVDGRAALPSTRFVDESRKVREDRRKKSRRIDLLVPKWKQTMADQRKKTTTQAFHFASIFPRRRWQGQKSMAVRLRLTGQLRLAHVIRWCKGTHYDDHIWLMALCTHAAHAHNVEART